MYGAFSYGGNVPYGAVDVTVFDFDAMLSDSTPKVYTAQIKVWNIATDTEETLYLGSTEFVTGPTDLPSSQPFRGVLTQPLVFRRSILGDTIGVFTTGDGQLVFSNSDGAYDTIVDTYAVDGREVVVRIGRISDPYTQHQVIFRGIAADWFADLDTVTVTLRDFGYRLDVPAQPTIYAGTGLAEGGTDLTGKRKPRVYGTIKGVPLTLINQASLIYQASDGRSDCLFSSVYDRGAALGTDGINYASYAALVAASVSAGNYIQCRSAGLVRLGAAPDGILFLTASGSIDLTADIVRDIVDAATDLSEDDIDSAGFDVVELAFPVVGDNFGQVGLYIGPDDTSTAADLIARLMAGIGGWAGFNRQGKLALGILVAPAGTPVAYFSEREGDIGELNRERLPSGIWPPPWRWRIAYQRAWTTFDDFAGTVDAATRAFYAQPYRLATAQDTGIVTDHPLAQDLTPVEAYFTNSNDAQYEADRRLDLYSAGYQLYRMTVSRRGLRCDIGNPIFVTHPRFGLSAGRLMTVVEISENINLADGSGADVVEIVAYG